MCDQKCPVFVLCGGRGSRLNSLTQQVPKALVPVNGRPMLNYILEQFQSQGFSKFVLGTGYLSEQVEKFVVANFPQPDIKISNAGVDAGMLQRIYFAKDHLANAPAVIIAYGDTFIDIDYQQLLAEHSRNKKAMTLVTGKIQNPFGIVTIDKSNQISCFVEKPVFDYYIGCLVFNPALLADLDPTLLKMNDGAGLVKLFQSLAERNNLNAFQHTGLQISFNTEPELVNAHEAIQRYRTVRENV